jgi:hypothetical protein
MASAPASVDSGLILLIYILLKIAITNTQFFALQREIPLSPPYNVPPQQGLSYAPDMSL